MVVVLVGIAPVFSLLFGVDTGNAAGVTLNGALMQDVIIFLGDVLIRMKTDYGEINTLLVVTGTILLLFLLKNIFEYLGLYTFTPIRTRVVENIRNDLYRKLLILPLSFFSKNKRGDLLARTGNDVQEIDETILKSIGISIADTVMFIGLVSCLFLISIPLAGITVIVLPFAAWLIGLASRSLKRKSPAMQEALGRLTTYIEESMRGVKTIFAYNNVPYCTVKFNEENRKFTRIKTSVYRHTDLGSPVSEVTSMFFVVLLLMAGGWLIFNDKTNNGLFILKPEAFVVFLIILVQLIIPAKNIANAWFNIKRGRASVARIKEILRVDEVITQAANAVTIEQFNESIEFKNVWFRYDDNDDKKNNAALKDLSLSVKKGQHIALVGLSGSGKSTLINLIPRFYDPSQGAVLIDGKDIREYRINDIRALSSLISQDTVLFNDTFYNNIRFGREDATREDIEYAAKEAYAHDFIIAAEKGYDTVIGNSGLKLSGGERQRISIARALLKDAPVLILDEASASLDTQAEQYIQNAVEVLQNKTVITVAHRLSTIRNADCIYVMEDGRIAESGTHEELAATEGIYKKLLETNM